MEMFEYETYKKKAIQLRKKELSYREILEKIPVARSTLSLWLRSVGLARAQKQRITQKKKEAAARACAVRRDNATARREEIYCKAEKEIRTISKRDLWLLGIALYWGEGNKEKAAKRGAQTRFSNSDPRMVRVFLRWLTEVIDIPERDIDVSLYIHESHRERLAQIKKYWRSELNLPMAKFAKVYYKKSTPNPRFRKNTGAGYYGQLRVVVRRSSTLLRKITGWIRGIDKTIMGDRLMVGLGTLTPAI